MGPGLCRATDRKGSRVLVEPHTVGIAGRGNHAANVETALLILVLTAGDPGSAAAGVAVAAALREQDPRAMVVLPPDAATRLGERGLRDADLVSRSEKPILVTAKDLHLVIVRVERRALGDDKIIDIEMWSGGRSDRMSAVVGKDGEPEPPASEGARRLLREALHDPATAAEHADVALIATFANQADWRGMINAVEARSDARPRLLHAAILAHLRLGDLPGAKKGLAAMRARYPDAELTKAATSAVESDVGGADALRDDAVSSQAESNVLR